MDPKFKKWAVNKIQERKATYPPIDFGRLTTLVIWGPTSGKHSITEGEINSLLVEVYKSRSSAQFLGKFIGIPKEDIPAPWEFKLL